MSLLDRLRRFFADAVSGAPDPQPARAVLPSRGHVVPKGPEYQATNLPPRERFRTACDFVKYLREMLPRVGLDGPAVDLFIAHLGRETGFGRGSADRGGKSLGVYDYNFGNKRAFGPTDAPWYRHVDGLPYRAYLSAAEGLRAMVDIVADNDRYTAAWLKLQAGDETWYSELGVAGYYETHDEHGQTVPVTRANVGSSQASYDRALASVRRCP